MSSVRTRYASSGEAEIAYQVRGKGPRDLLVFTPVNIPIDCIDEEPSFARFERRLATMGRLLRFDRRGIGLSDRGSTSNPPGLEEWVADALAVLDAVGSEASAVLAPYNTSPVGMAVAALRPERVTKLVVINGFARTTQAPDYPEGVPTETLTRALSAATDTDAVELGVDVLANLAPSVARDRAFRSWWDRAGNLGSTPAMARAMQARQLTTDVRHLLPRVAAPTLVIQRDGIEHGVARSRYLADHIPDARYVQLPGQDRLHWVGDTTMMLDEIEEFLTGSRGGPGTERVLATILFTDIVGSTERAVALGDQSWRDLLERHDETLRRNLQRFRGREINTVGDGFLAVFDSPSKALECAFAIRDDLQPLGLEVRAGVHTGEIELRGADIAGLAVHVCARITALAGTGVVLASESVPALVAGSNFVFADQGQHQLKGVPGIWHVFGASRQ